MQTLSFIGAMVLVFMANGLPMFAGMFGVTIFEKMQKEDNSTLVQMAGLIAERLLNFHFIAMPLVYFGFFCAYFFWSRSATMEAVNYLYIPAVISAAVLGMALIVAKP